MNIVVGMFAKGKRLHSMNPPQGMTHRAQRAVPYVSPYDRSGRVASRRPCSRHAFLIRRAVLFLLVAALCLSVPCAADDTETAPAPAPSPEALDVLRPYLADKAAFESKVRTFEKLHLGIARGAYVRARLLEEEGDREGAQALSDTAQQHIRLVKAAYDLGLATFDNSAPLHNYYGELVHDYLGRPNEAAQHWKRAVQLDKNYARAHCNFGMYALHGGMYGIGLESMEAALALEPNNPDFLFNMAQVYLVHFPQVMQMRKWDRDRVYKEAMKLSERAAKYAPDDFDVLRDHALNFFLGEEFGVKVNWRDAARAWERTRAKARTETEVFNTWLNEARVHRSNKDEMRMKACLVQAQAIWPDSPVVRQLIQDFHE